MADVLWVGVPLVLLGVWPLGILGAARARRGTTATENTAVVGRRVVAHLVDLAFVVGAIVALDWIVVQWAIAFDLGSVDMSWNGAATWACLAVDFIVLQGLTGYTLGKWFLRLQTVAPGGQRPGLWRALVRSIPLIFEWIGLIALWAMLRNSDHQRYGDRWAHTRVVADARPWPAVFEAGWLRRRKSAASTAVGEA